MELLSDNIDWCQKDSSPINLASRILDWCLSDVLMSAYAQLVSRWVSGVYGISRSRLCSPIHTLYLYTRCQINARKMTCPYMRLCPIIIYTKMPCNVSETHLANKPRLSWRHTAPYLLWGLEEVLQKSRDCSLYPETAVRDTFRHMGLYLSTITLARSSSGLVSQSVSSVLRRVKGECCLEESEGRMQSEWR